VLEHGGNLRQAAKNSSIPLNQWLDLSTGVNPNGWPVPEVPSRVWQRLPEINDGLEQAARDYYGCDLLLPVAGSQAAITRLPQLRDRSRVGLLALSYNEHAAAWQRAGHEVVLLQAETVAEQLQTLDVLLLVNPNNPTGTYWSVSQLRDFSQQLAKRGGWLIVDEAFIDATPEQSMLPFVGEPGLIVLRSLGKFFGLAGVRLGFVFAWRALLAELDELANPWEVNHVARYVGRMALMDDAWQRQTRRELPKQVYRLAQLLDESGLSVSGGCALFQWCERADAESLQQQLAQQGVWVRLFRQQPSVRFGLPADEDQWQRLQIALRSLGRG